MQPSIFKTEEFFEKYEFSCPHLLSASDCESISVEELLKAGDGSSEELLKIKLGYTESTGSREVRDKISSRYKKISADQVIMLGAPVEGIFLAMQTLLKKDDHVILLTPAYDALINVPQMLTQNISYWPLLEGVDCWSIDFELLEKLIKKETKAIVINFPHNPTGFAPSKKELELLVEKAKEFDCWIFSDEMYKGLEYKKEDEVPSVAELYKKSVVLSGLSKNLGLPGLRFGWVIIQDDQLYKSFVNWKYYTSLCATKVSEYLGIIGLQAFESLAQKNINQIQKNLMLAEACFNGLEKDFQWIRPMAGSVSIVKCLKRPAEELCDEMAQKYGIVLLPSHFMGLEDKYFRLGLGRESFKEAITAFKKIYIR